MRDRRYFIAGTAFEAPDLAPGLYVVSTPIGNLRDMTLRGLETLAAADVIYCEDTRTSLKLCEHFGIGTPRKALHEHNERALLDTVLDDLRRGGKIALISDAGTPLVSDPGYRLVGEALERGIRVVPVPGPSAALAALTASGLPSDAFLFAGFLPVKTGQRLTKLETFRQVPATLIFFESPRRLAETLGAMVEVLGGSRQAAIGRELTKAFEEMRTGTLTELADHYAAADTPKGEVVVCVGPAEAKADEPADIDRLLLSLAAEMPASKAAAEAAKMTGGQKQALYRRLLELKDGP